MQWKRTTSNGTQALCAIIVLQHVTSWAKKSMKFAGHDEAIEVVQAGKGPTNQRQTDSLVVALVHVASLLTRS